MVMTYSSTRTSANAGDPTAGLLGGEQDSYRVAKLLDRATPQICTDLFAMAKPVPPNSSETVRFRRIKNIIDLSVFGKLVSGGGAASNAAQAMARYTLAEGTLPTETVLSYEAYDLALQEFGLWAGITDKVDALNQNAVVDDGLDVIGDAVAEIKEIQSWSKLCNGNQIRYANAVANRAAVASAISLGDIRAATKVLMRNKAKMITNILDGSTKIGTRPVEAAYIALGHTDLLPDLRGLSGFTPVSQYGSMKPTCPNEVGAIENVRFVLSPVFSPGAAGSTYPGAATATSASFSKQYNAAGTNCDVYPVIIMGANAFGSIVLRGYDAAKVMVRLPNNPAPGDELGQKGSIGAKTWFNAGILAEQWIVRLEVLCSV
jgi:N4-gp56 family major capsid protein